MHWFRVYSREANDQTIGSLSDSEYRAYMVLQCLACETNKGGYTGVSAHDTEWVMRRDYTAEIQTLNDAGFVSIDGDGVVIVENWDEKQKKYDDVAGRMRRLRERQKAEKAAKPSPPAQKKKANGKAGLPPKTKIPKTAEAVIKRRVPGGDFSSWPGMPSAQVMNDWLDMRKTKKAPISQTVIATFGKQLHEAKRQGMSVDYCLSECVTRNWQGLKVEWLAKSFQQRRLQTGMVPPSEFSQEEIDDSVRQQEELLASTGGRGHA